MSVSNISLKDNVKVQNNNTTLNKEQGVVSSLQANNLQQQPTEDNFNGKGLNKKKVLTYASVGTILATLVGIAIDFRFSEGKHVKKLWNKLTGRSAEVKTKTNEVPNIEPKTGTPNIKEPQNVVPTRPNTGFEPPKEISDDIVVPKNTEPKATQNINSDTQKGTQGIVEDIVVTPKTTEPKPITPIEQPKIKPQAPLNPITEKNYINSKTHSPVKEKWQGETLLERTTKTEDGLVTTTYKNGKVESVYTDGNMFQELEIYFSDGKTVKESYFWNMGVLHIERGKTNIAIPRIKEEQFHEAVKLSQKYAQKTDQELEILYNEVLSGNPNNMSFFEFNILEAHRDVFKLTIPKTSKATQITEHHHLNGRNHIYRNTPEKLEVNGKTLRDIPVEEWDALSKEEELIYERNENFKWHYPKMQEIDKAIQDLPPLEKDCVFYRGLGERFIPDSIINGKVGDIVVPDNGYAYTAFNRELAYRFGGHQYIIRTPKGAKVSRNMEHRGEAVFPRNAQYRIISKYKTPADDIYPQGLWRIELEYILPQA